MKNKIAERAKRKRRQEKRAAEAAFAKELTEGVKQRAKEHGIKPRRFKQADIIRIHKQVERETIFNAIRDDIIIMTYVLHKFHGWGTQRLARYIEYAQKYIGTVGNNDRNIPSMEYDLRADTGIDCKILFDGYEPCRDKPKSVETEQKKLFLTHTKYVLPMVLYALYYDLGWRHKRMTRAADEFRHTVIAVIELDSMGDINRELFKKRNIRFDEEGKVHINEERE